jgi:hypothetical protein
MTATSGIIRGADSRFSSLAAALEEKGQTRHVGSQAQSRELNLSGGMPPERSFCLMA